MFCINSASPRTVQLTWPSHATCPPGKGGVRAVRNWAEVEGGEIMLCYAAFRVDTSQAKCYDSGIYASQATSVRRERTFIRQTFTRPFAFELGTPMDVRISAGCEGRGFAHLVRCWRSSPRQLPQGPAVGEVTAERSGSRKRQHAPGTLRSKGPVPTQILGVLVSAATLSGNASRPPRRAGDRVCSFLSLVRSRGNLIGGQPRRTARVVRPLSICSDA